MDLTDAFNASAAMLKRLETVAEKTVHSMGLATKEHGSSGAVDNGISCYEWLWTLAKESVHGVETFRRTLRISFRQHDLSPAETPVTCEWKSEIFRKTQLSWYSKSGLASRCFKDVVREGFKSVLKEALAKADAALQDKKLPE